LSQRQHQVAWRGFGCIGETDARLIDVSLLIPENISSDNGYPSQWAAIESIAPKIGCVPQTLHEWVRRHEIDSGLRDGVTTEEREVKELRRANEILKLASAFFAQAELDRRIKS
jgi:transposase